MFREGEFLRNGSHVDSFMGMGAMEVAHIGLMTNLGAPMGKKFVKKSEGRGAG